MSKGRNREWSTGLNYNFTCIGQVAMWECQSLVSEFLLSSELINSLIFNCKWSFLLNIFHNHNIWLVPILLAQHHGNKIQIPPDHGKKSTTFTIYIHLYCTCACITCMCRIYIHLYYMCETSMLQVFYTCITGVIQLKHHTCITGVSHVLYTCRVDEVRSRTSQIWSLAKFLWCW